MDIFLEWFDTCGQTVFPVIMKLYEWFDKIFFTTVADLLGNDPAVLAFVPAWMEVLNIFNVVFGVGLVTFCIAVVVKWVIGIIT